MSSVRWDAEIAEVCDETYAAMFEPSVLGPMADVLAELAGANEIPVTIGDITAARVPGTFSPVYLVANTETRPGSSPSIPGTSGSRPSTTS
jgi:hypothetical protein